MLDRGELFFRVQDVASPDPFVCGAAGWVEFNLLAETYLRRESSRSDIGRLVRNSKVNQKSFDRSGIDYG